MPQYERHFTLEEARDWTPVLRAKFGRIHALYEEMEVLRLDFDRVRRVIAMNGHAPKTLVFEACAAKLKELVQEIIDAGIEIKDIERGLVDFPHMRNGEEVFLCWELADEGLDYWHYIEDGYMGRKEI